MATAQDNGPGRKIHILKVATSFPADAADWRGVFIRNVAEALARRNDTELMLWAPPGEAQGSVLRIGSDADHRHLQQLMRQGGIAHLLRRRPLKGLLAAARLLGAQRRLFRSHAADLYHINWLQNALALPADGRPAVVTALGTDMQLLGLPLVRTMLRRVLAGRRAAVCPNAAWMAAPLRRVFGASAAVIPVPFGIDPAWYRVDRSPSAGAANDWLVVSRLTRGKIGFLFEWAEPHFKDPQRVLHLFGPMQEKLDVPSWVRLHGPAGPEELREAWFPRARGLVTLSQHAEGRPQVMLEAMAAGLPIIASRLPAHEDLLDDGHTGLLVDSREALGKALNSVESGAGEKLGAAAREWAERNIGTWDDCAARYYDVYLDLLRPGQ